MDQASPTTMPGAPAAISAEAASAMVLPEGDVSHLQAELEASRATRDEAYEVSRKVKALCSEAVSGFQYALDSAPAALAQARGLLDAYESARPHEPGCRDGGLREASEAYLKAKAFENFLLTGRVLSRAEVGADFDDEEYLCGIISACEELGHYALRRATALDVRSVVLCRDFIAEVKAELLEFDFRNGPVRRKFDGIKYTERRCENMLYELSFAVPGAAAPAAPAAKRARLDDEAAAASNVLDKAEWQALRDNYTAHDQKRESVIKECRDVQKAAKQAIYALHRGDGGKASSLIEKATAGAAEIWGAHVEGAPSLRYGSFSNALEELAEAELFQHWLRAIDAPAEGAAVTLLPERAALCNGLLKADEYLGALSDFTGEVGRVAVEGATRRDHALVTRCVAAVFASHALLASVPLSGKQLKKVEAAERNFRKLETIQYDMVVRSNQSGPSTVDVAPPASDAAQGKDEQ